MKRPALSMIPVRLLALLVLFGLPSLPVRADEAACPETAQQYWNSFRVSVLQGDPTTIANASRFPFTIFRGNLDADRKTIRINPQAFIRIFPALLQADPGLSPTAITMKSLIETTTRLPPSHCCNSDGTRFRVGDWGFHLTPEGWRFAEVHVDDEFIVQ
jgi:hypothetical protein